MKQHTNQTNKRFEEVKLEDLFELKYGSSLPQEKRVVGKYNVYGSNGIVGKHNLSITKGETIIVGRKGSIGKINFSNNSCFPIDTTYYIDETKKPCNLKWLYFILKQLNLESLNRAAAVPGLNRKDVYLKKIFLPEISEQDKIVEILERAKKLQESGEKSENLLDEYLKSLFNEMFYNKNFEEVKLGDICETTSGGTPSRIKKEYWENGTILWVKSGELDRGYIFDTEEKITELGLKNSSVKYFEPNTVLIAMYGATIGKTALLKVKATTNQAICGLIPKNKENLNPVYLLYVLASLKKELISGGIGGGQPNISQQIIKKTKIPFPPFSLQKKFAKIVEQIEVLKENAKKTKKNSEELFNSLINKAVRGNL